MSDCVFCRIVARQIPATVVHEDEHTLAFMDLGQVNPGPRAGGGEEACREPLRAGRRAGRRRCCAPRRAWRAPSATRSQPEGLSVYQANGKAAGQTVFHYHVHLVPRHDGDGMALTWPVKNPPREKLEEYAAKIRASLPG